MSRRVKDNALKWRLLFSIQYSLYDVIVSDHDQGPPLIPKRVSFQHETEEETRKKCDQDRILIERIWVLGENI